MKRFLIATAVSSLCLLPLTSCYEDYVKDYDYSGVYLAYQYDLRSFVVGEGMQFKIGAVLGGVLENNRDRDIWYIFNDNLVTEDLRMYVPDSESSFTAFSEMTGTTNVGAVSQDYVRSAMTASGISALTPLPSDAIQTPSGRCISIARGNHTGTAVIKADSTAFLSLSGASPRPYYAFGIQITSADADTVLLSKSYEVIALRYENLLFGTWYHNGKTQISDAEGNVIDTKVYHSEANTDDLCNLTTVAPDVVEADKTGHLNGKLRIAVDGGVLSLSAAPDGPAIEDLGSSFNNVRLLQDRKLYLNYKFTDASGNVNVVNDTLSFRNRIRDGVNEWQDENPEHYNK